MRRSLDQIGIAFENLVHLTRLCRGKHLPLNKVVLSKVTTKDGERLLNRFIEYEFVYKFQVTGALAPTEQDPLSLKFAHSGCDLCHGSRVSRQPTAPHRYSNVL